MAKKKTAPVTAADETTTAAATQQKPVTNEVPSGDASVAGKSSDPDPTRETPVVDSTGEDQLREFRVLLDSNVKALEDLQYEFREHPHAGSITRKGRGISTHIERSIEDVMFAKAWIGKVLEARGASNPYGKGYQDVHDIVETADTAERSDSERTKKRPSYVGQVSDMRDRLGSALQILDKLEGSPSTRKEAIAWTQAYVKLTEAKLHLGFEFARIKADDDGR